MQSFETKTASIGSRHSIFGAFGVAIVLGLIAAVYWPTLAILLGLGKGAETSTDAPLVISVAFFLIWTSRQGLNVASIRPFFPGGLIVIVLGMIWLCGQLVYTRVFTQFAVLSLIPAVVLTIFGTKWLWVLRFPFFILFFALPIWSPIVPTLVNWSAAAAELAIRVSGVPIYRDGAYFVLPSGSWAIADACSGVVFLSTSLLLGVLYAATFYKSTRKRLFFISSAAIIGVVGNWIRVYLTMMIAHVSENRLLREDHYMFGWGLFAIFLFCLCWMGWRYRDDLHGGEGICASLGSIGEQGVQKVITARLMAAFAASAVLVSMWPLMYEHFAPPPAEFIQDKNVANTGKWVALKSATSQWSPELRKPDRVKTQVFERDGKRVTLFLGYYQNESWDSKLVTASNQLAGGDGSKWSIVERGRATVEFSGQSFEAKTGVVLGGGRRILSWHWYAVDGLATASDLRAKLKQLSSRLSGTNPASVWVCISTDASQSNAEASATLKDFLQAAGPENAEVLGRSQS